MERSVRFFVITLLAILVSISSACKSEVDKDLYETYKLKIKNESILVKYKFPTSKATGFGEKERLLKNLFDGNNKTYWSPSLVEKWAWPITTFDLERNQECSFTLYFEFSKPIYVSGINIVVPNSNIIIKKAFVSLHAPEIKDSGEPYNEGDYLNITLNSKDNVYYLNLKGARYARFLPPKKMYLTILDCNLMHGEKLKISEISLDLSNSPINDTPDLKLSEIVNIINNDPKILHHTVKGMQYWYVDTHDWKNYDFQDEILSNLFMHDFNGDKGANELLKKYGPISDEDYNDYLDNKSWYELTLKNKIGSDINTNGQ